MLQPWPPRSSDRTVPMSKNPFEHDDTQFEPLRARSFQILKYTVLTVGLIAMTAITVPDVHARSGKLLNVVLWCCLGFFICELAVKYWIHSVSKRGASYLLSSAGLIDIVAVLPIPIAFSAGIPAETAWLFASLWLFKLTTTLPGISLLGRVISIEARALTSVLAIFLFILLLAAVALHVVEGTGQPKQFGTLPRSLWWAVTTLTTTGYGDAVPETLLGRTIAGVVMICGLGVFGLLTGILATGFAAEHRRRDFLRNRSLVTEVPFLRDLDAPSIIELTRMLRRLDLPERSIVVRRGRPGDCMYFIASGEVEVKVEPRPVRLGAGAFFGEIALLDSSPRTATVVTTMPTTLLILEVSDFHAFTAHHPDLAKAVELEAARRKTKVKDDAAATH
jgi:voltage-gated potassium channel